MRHILPALSKLALGAAAVVLLVATLTLRQGSTAAFDSRDAFAVQIQTGVRALSVPTIAAEWRQEIAAQRMTAQRDLLLSRVLCGTGLFVLIAFGISVAGGRAEPPHVAS